MIDNQEFGYTPNNLKALRKAYGLTQTKVAEITNTARHVAISRWELPIINDSHADMPQYKWAVLIEYCKNNLQKK